MNNKHKYVKSTVEIVEFSNEEVVMNLVASSDDIIPPNEQPPVIYPQPPVVTPPQPPIIPPHGDVYDDFE